jgi:hypothetical protein
MVRLLPCECQRHLDFSSPAVGNAKKDLSAGKKPGSLGSGPTIGPRESKVPVSGFVGHRLFGDDGFHDVKFRIAARRLGPHNVRRAKNSRSKSYKNNNMGQLISSSHRTVSYRRMKNASHRGAHSDLFFRQLAPVWISQVCDTGHASLCVPLVKSPTLDESVRSGRHCRLLGSTQLTPGKSDYRTCGF